jgi:hypothetical protein
MRQLRQALRLSLYYIEVENALAEMVRVTRRGGWIVAVDTDWGSLSIDHPEIDIERRLARVLPEKAVPDGYAGRQLFRWFRRQ